MAPLSLLLLPVSVLVGEAHAADGILRVKASVPSAEVYLDGKLVGSVPLTTYVSPGTHTLRVVADNFDPYVRRVEVGADKTVEVNVSLQPGGGTVEFDGPGGARLVVDGRDRGVLPIRLSDLGPGAHSWRVEAPKYEPTTGNLQVERGRNYLLEVELLPSRGIFEVTTEPAGAEVWLDGKLAGTSPLKLEGVAPAVHGVELRLDGHARLFKEVDTTDGSRATMNVDLPAKGTRLVVATGADDGKVYVNGVLAGEGTRVEVPPVAKGRVELVVEAGGASTSTATNLNGSGSLAFRVEDGELHKRPPLYQRWGFWAAVGGGAAVAAGAGTATAVALQPPPPPTGDTTVVLP